MLPKGAVSKAGRLYYRFRMDGRDYAGPLDLADTPRNRISAESLIEAKRRSVKEGRDPETRIKARRFGDAATEFLSWTEVEYRGKPNTWKRIRVSFASLTEFFADPMVMQLDKGRIGSYMTWRRKEHNIREVTLRHDIHSLSLFFRWGMDQGYVRHNPVQSIKVPSDSGAVREHVLTAAEEHAYFAEARRNSNLYDVARLILNQGFRPEEAMSLEKSGFNREKRQITVFQGKSATAKRTLDLIEESFAILDMRSASPSKWFFPSSKRPGEYITKLNCPHNRVQRKIKASWVLYDLRHTFATRMAEAGVDVVTLARILGHSNLRTVMRYVHPTADHMKAAMHKFEQAQRARILDEAAGAVN